MSDNNISGFSDSGMYDTYDSLVMCIHNSGKDYDMAMIERAYLLANEAHSGQRRKSGAP